MPKKYNDWYSSVDEATKQAMLNYTKDRDIIQDALSSLERLKTEVLPKHENLATRCFLVILETVWKKLQNINKHLTNPGKFYVDLPGGPLYARNWWEENRKDREKNTKQMCIEILALQPILQEWYDKHGTPELIIVRIGRIQRTEQNLWDDWICDINCVQNDMSEKHVIVAESALSLSACNKQKKKVLELSSLLTTLKHHFSK
jgi:hypothetical protein